jgi:hypothetical protein
MLLPNQNQLAFELSCLCRTFACSITFTDWRNAVRFAGGIPKAVPRGELPLECVNAAFSKIRWEPK